MISKDEMMLTGWGGGLPPACIAGHWAGRGIGMAVHLLVHSCVHDCLHPTLPS